MEDVLQFVYAEGSLKVFSRKKGDKKFEFRYELFALSLGYESQEEHAWTENRFITAYTHIDAEREYTSATFHTSWMGVLYMVGGTLMIGLLSNNGGLARATKALALPVHGQEFLGSPSQVVTPASRNHPDAPSRAPLSQRGTPAVD